MWHHTLTCTVGHRIQRTTRSLFYDVEMWDRYPSPVQAERRIRHPFPCAFKSDNHQCLTFPSPFPFDSLYTPHLYLGESIQRLLSNSTAHSAAAPIAVISFSCLRLTLLKNNQTLRSRWRPNHRTRIGKRKPALQSNPPAPGFRGNGGGKRDATGKVRSGSK
jgi:hypothetical protein